MASPLPPSPVLVAAINHALQLLPSITIPVPLHLQAATTTTTFTIGFPMVFPHVCGKPEWLNACLMPDCLPGELQLRYG
ncbi:hypothetical protein E2C01_019786 [Portunus trituberculatus]|uniref:Uncharacterized protein n=1 Tax=Portunus trituberculatus TaxID=210409 RepID=A0A5B7DYK5_PORTR|nr:hypothetical protein [Portunus trituberculatus]